MSDQCIAWSTDEENYQWETKEEAILIIYGYPNVSKDARAELESMLIAWADQHCKPDFFLIEDSEPYVITAEDVEAKS